jgi:hypothetical protein
MSTMPGAALGQQGFQVITPGTYQKVTTSGTSAQSSATQGTTTIVQLYADQDCYVAFGSNPTATTSTMFLPLGQILYVGVTPGHKIAVIQSTTAGTLFITEGL